MAQPSDYKHLQYWHQLTGSLAPYWKNLQRMAAEANAPTDTVYFDANNDRWVVAGEVKNKAFIEAIERRIALERK